MIHWELCKKFNFYQSNPVYVQENETHKLLWDFDIQTDHLISARRLELIIITIKKEQKKKRTYKIVEFAAPTDLRIKLKENEKKKKCQEIARE